jgi:hypothetical protein
LPLSLLYAWQSVLDVPVAELLAEPDDGLSSSVSLRSHLLRLMKTVQSISETTKQDSIKRLAETMVGQLVDLMPELADVGAWVVRSEGRRRSELGVSAERHLSAGVFVTRGESPAWFDACLTG